MILPTKRGEAAKLLSIEGRWGDLDRRLLIDGRQFISTPKLLNRFGQVHPYSRKPERLGALLGVVHALCQGQTFEPLSAIFIGSFHKENSPFRPSLLSDRAVRAHRPKLRNGVFRSAFLARKNAE